MRLLGFALPMLLSPLAGMWLGWGCSGRPSPALLPVCSTEMQRMREVILGLCLWPCSSEVPSSCVWQCRG